MAPVITNRLLADAEVGEDVGEEVGGGDGAGEGGEVVEGFADVLGYEVAGEVGPESLDGLAYGLGGGFECLVVPDIGDGDFSVGGCGGGGYV